MKRCHVLAVDPHIETRENLAFLLRLARFKVSLARDELEAINRIINNEGTSEASELMIINHFSLSAEEPEGVAELYRLSLRLPILLVIRPGSQEKTAALLKIAKPDCRLGQCKPAEILTRIKQIRHELRKTPGQQTADEKHPNERRNCQ